MATTIKKPKITPPTRGEQQAKNRPEYESQVPGLIDRAGAEKMLARKEPLTYMGRAKGETLEVMPQKPATMRPETLSQVPKELGWSRPETTQRGGPRRLPVPTELKRKSKIKAKAKRGDVYVDGARVGAVAGLPRG